MEEQQSNQTAPIKNKHTDDLIDHYWGSINYISSLIKASELKAGLILTFYGILLNFIYTNLKPIIDTIENATGFYIILGVCFISIIVSIYFSIRCFMPRIEDKYDKNIFFFGDVTTSFGTIKEFSKTFYKISMDEDQLFDQLGQQIFINSKIAKLKFENIKKSLRYLVIALIIINFLMIYYALDSFI